MKKHAYILIITALFAVVSIFSFSICIDSQKNIFYNGITNVYGDFSELEDLLLSTVKIPYSDYLFWDITQNFDGELITESQFSFNRNRTNPYMLSHKTYEDSLSETIASYDNFGFKSYYYYELPSHLNREIDVPKHMQALEKSTKHNEIREDLVYLTDYYDYYRVYLYDIKLFDYEDFENYDYSSNLYFIKSYDNEFNRDINFTDYFKIPINEKLQHRITVEKNEDGYITTLSSENPSSQNYYIDDSISFLDTVTTEGIFLYYNSTLKNKDTYGIHFIPFKEATTDEDFKEYDIFNAQMIHSLEENIEVSEMFLGKDDETLVLVCRDNMISNTQNLFLKIIDLNTNKIIQELPLNIYRTDEAESSLPPKINFFKVFDDFFLLSFDNDIFTIITEENKVFSVNITADIRQLLEFTIFIEYPYFTGKLPDGNPFYNPNINFYGFDYWFYKEYYDIDYKDDKVAIAFNNEYAFGGRLIIAIFDDNGLLHISSLSDNTQSRFDLIDIEYR